MLSAPLPQCFGYWENRFGTRNHIPTWNYMKQLLATSGPALWIPSLQVLAASLRSSSGHWLCYVYQPWLEPHAQWTHGCLHSIDQRTHCVAQSSMQNLKESRFLWFFGSSLHAHQLDWSFILFERMFSCENWWRGCHILALSPCYWCTSAFLWSFRACLGCIPGTFISTSWVHGLNKMKHLPTISMANRTIGIK